MQQVTATAGEVVVAKVPPRPEMWVCMYFATGPQEWCAFEPSTTEGVAKSNGRYCKRRGMKFEIVRIPAEEVKDGN